MDFTVLDGAGTDRLARCASRVDGWETDSEARHYLPRFYAKALRDPNELSEEFGIDICDVLGGAGLAGGVSMVTVTSQASSIASAAEASPFWSDLVTSENIDGFDFYDWGWDRHLGEVERTELRPTSTGGQLAVDLPNVYRAAALAAPPTPPDLVGRLGEWGPLADRPAVPAMTQIMMDSGAYGFRYTDLPRLLQREYQATQSDGHLEQWLSAGIGTAIRADGTSQVIVVMAYPNARAAQENSVHLASILTEVWQYRDLLDVESVQTDGSAVVALIGSLDQEQPAIDVVLEALNEGGPMFAIATEN